MRPQILSLLTVSSMLLSVAALAQTPTRSISACRNLQISVRPSRPWLAVEPSDNALNLPPETRTAVTAAYNLAKSGQGILALQTARSISDQEVRLRITRGLIEYLTSDEEFAQTIAILKTVRPNLRSGLAGSVAEELALKGKLSYAMQALQLISDEPGSASNRSSTALRDVLVTLVKRGRSAEALELIQMMPNLNQKDDSISDVAIALADSKQFPRAVDVAQMISSTSIKSFALLQITESLTRAGQLYPALEVAQTISEAGDRALGLQAVAGGLLKAGRSDEALQLTQTLEDCEIRATTSIQVARRYREMKQPKQAAAILDQALHDAAALKFFGSRVQVSIDLASEYRQLGQREQALKLLQQALKVTQAARTLPGQTYPLDFPQETKGDFLSRIAKEYRLLGRQNQALQLLTEALKNVQTIKFAYSKAAQLRQIAAEYKALGQSTKAAELLAQVSKLSSPLPQIPALLRPMPPAQVNTRPSPFVPLPTTD